MTTNCKNSQNETEVMLNLEENAEVATPYLSARLLCPPNLGALLESTTATPLAGSWKEKYGVQTSYENLEEVGNGGSLLKNSKSSPLL